MIVSDIILLTLLLVLFKDSVELVFNFSPNLFSALCLIMVYCKSCSGCSHIALPFELSLLNSDVCIP
jgi:hypothetical protein